MKSFKEMFLEFSFDGNPAEKEVEIKDINHAKSIIGKFIVDYDLTSYTSYSFVNDKRVDFVFSGENAKPDTDLLNKLIPTKMPALNYSISVTDAIVLTCYI